MGHGEKENNSDLYGITVFVPTSDLMSVFHTLVYTLHNKYKKESIGHFRFILSPLIWLGPMV